MTTFNGARFVALQLRSILDQTHPAIEVVIADDGSTDETPRILQEFARSDPRVVLLPPGARLGVTANLERAIAQCTADVIALADQDDRWDPRKLELLAPHAATARPTAVVTDASVIDEDAHPTGRSLWSSVGLGQDEMRLIEGGGALEVAVRRNVATGATMVINRPLLDVALPLTRHGHHDAWLAACAAVIGQVVLVPTPLIEYRVHDANAVGLRRGLAARLRQRRGRTDRHELQEAFWTDVRDRVVEHHAAAGHADELALIEEKVRHTSERRRLMSERRTRRLGALAPRSTRARYRRFEDDPRASLAWDLLAKRAR